MTSQEKNLLRNAQWLLGSEPLPARPEATPATVSGDLTSGKQAFHFGHALPKARS